MWLCMCVAVFQPSWLQITGGVIWTLYDWLSIPCCFSAPFYGPGHDIMQGCDHSDEMQA